MTGLILEIPASEYHADFLGPAVARPTLSASIAKILISQSPAHAKAAHPKLNPNLTRDDDPKFDLGNICHALILQGIETADVLHFDSWRTKDAKEARTTSRAHGRIPLLAHDWQRVQEMMQATHQWIAALAVDPLPFTDGHPEQTLVWDDHGVACRARIDWLQPTLIDDYKTTSASANPKTWSDRTMYGIGGDIQAAFYVRGLKAVTGADARFRFIVQETYAPFALSVIEIGPDVLAIGDAKVEMALELWRRGLDTGVWPCYPPTAYRAELPTWEESRWLEREAREEIAA